jgi:hypothetical protein
MRNAIIHDDNDPLVFSTDEFYVWHGGNRNIGLTHQLKKSFARGTIQESIYKLAFKPEFLNERFIDILSNIENALDQMIERLNTNYGGSDIVRICILSPNFYVPQSLALQPLSQLTVKQIMDLLDNVLQSDEDLSLLEGFEIHIGIASNPLGGGKNSRGFHMFDNINCDVHRNWSTVKIISKDNLCFARSVVVARAQNRVVKAKNEYGNKSKEAKFESKKYKNLIERSIPGYQTEAAQALHLQAGMAPDRRVSFTDIPRFEKVTKTQIIVLASHVQHKVAYAGSKSRKEKVFLLFRKGKDGMPGHYHPIVHLSSFFRKSFLCPSCLTMAQSKDKHSCDGYCNLCLSSECPRDRRMQIVCSDCNRMTRSTECMTRHKEKGVCSKMIKCILCSVIYARKSVHICGSRKCNICNKIVTGTHFCSIRAAEPKEIAYKYMFADFEARFTDTGVHVANLIIAHWHCEECIDITFRENPKCSQCGNECAKCSDKIDSKSRGHAEREVCMTTPECGVREIKYFGDDCSEKFCKFFFHDRFTGYCLFFHNLKGYDSYFIMSYLCREALVPRVIYRGSKVISIKIEGRLRQRVCDTLNYLTMPLSAFPKVFQLKNLLKGTFPHLYNQKQNYTVVDGPLPPTDAYAPDQMKPNSREAFFKWYNEEMEKGTKFHFMEAIENYCRDDVNILQESSLLFRKNLIELTKKEVVVDVGEGGERKTKIYAIDPLTFTTMASICMNVYRTLFLPETHELELQDGRKALGILQNESWKEITLLDSEGNKCQKLDLDAVSIASSKFLSSPLAKMPAGGFQGMNSFSKASIHWLMYVSHVEGVHIQHALNSPTGEFQIPSPNMPGLQMKSRLDGWAETTKTAFLYHGCINHGCPHCYSYPVSIQSDYDSMKDPFPTHPHTGQTMRELFLLTKKYETYITDILKYNLVTMWECDFKNMIESDLHLRQFIESNPVRPRLSPRDSLFGGRVNSCTLVGDVRGTSRQIHYADITSLYPTVLKYDVFPVGFPEIILNPDTTDIAGYFGLIYCRVRPPRGLYHPVLPIKTKDKKLVFSLCRKCAETRPSERCFCSDNDRDLEGTWCSVELSNAVSKGYSIISIFEVYHFAETSTDLFTGYVNLFLKRKQEASGWPRPDMNEKEKDEYIREYFKAEGILLDKESIEYNGGMRQTNKNILNNLWGKFCEGQDYRKHVMVNTCSEFYKYLTNPTLTLKDFHVFCEETAQVEFTHKDGHTPECPYINIFVGIFTTAHARTRLYKEMDRLGPSVYYYDTDSLVYEIDSKDPDPIHPEYGSYLGQWTNELQGSEHIVEFISSGPKSYCYLTSNGRKVIKIKGMTLNHMALKSITFESIKGLVLHYIDPDTYPLPQEANENHCVSVNYPMKIKRNRYTFTLYNEPMQKDFRVTYGKRMLLRDGSFDTIPFGY